MPRRRDQLPKSAIGPHHDLGTNELHADLGHMFHDDVARLFFLALSNENEREGLLEYFSWVVEHRDLDAFKHMQWAFDLVVKQLRDSTPQNRTMLLAIRYEADAEAHGERATGAGLAKFLRAHGITTDASYARKLRRQLTQFRTS
jgi:hypothetical protein